MVVLTRAVSNAFLTVVVRWEGIPDAALKNRLAINKSRITDGYFSYQRR
jgi:hypothetical protein